MNEMTYNMGPGPVTMSSREIADLVKKRHDNVKRTIETLADCGTIVRPHLEDEQIFDSVGRPRTEKVYRVNERDSYVVVAQLSPEFTARLVDYWQSHKSQPAQKQLTTTETLIEMLTIQANIERKQAEQGRVINSLVAKVAEVETAQTVLSSRPAAAEAISHIRTRIGRKHGLSTGTIDAVMRQSPYAPKPAGMVKNEHANADGATYAVFWQKDVTATFDRFVRECTQVTPALFTHPFVVGRFKMSAKREAA